MLTLNQIKDYLKRLGTEMNSPTIEFLFELHKKHVEKISWQTIDIFAGAGVDFDPKEIKDIEEFKPKHEFLVPHQIQPG